MSKEEARIKFLEIAKPILEKKGYKTENEELVRYYFRKIIFC